MAATHAFGLSGDPSAARRNRNPVCEPLRGEPMDWRLLVAVYALAVVILVLHALYMTRSGPLFVDTDDAMRLTNLHDFLAGQGWYDHIQHRLNVPYGGEIPWSRLLDSCEAGLLLVFRQVLPADIADIALGYAWPLLLLAPLLYLSGRLTLVLVGREGLLASLILTILSPVLIGEFRPGRLDHHSVQILLTLLATLCAVEAARRPRFAVGAGIAVMTGLAIGGECLPVLAAVIAGFTMMWVMSPRHAAAMRYFAISFAIAGVVHLGIALPPDRWFEPACDAISIVYIAAGLGTGVALAVLSMLPLSRYGPGLRFAFACVGGAVVLGGVALAFPECLRGPYAALDPWLVTHWLNHVSESETLWQAIQGLDAATFGIIVPLVLALAAMTVRLRRGGEGREQWLVLAAIVLLTSLVSILQIRGARLALAPAVPACAWLIAEARAAYLARRRARAMLGLIASWLSSAGLIVAVAAVLATMPFTGSAAAEAGAGSCLVPSAFKPLAAMPPARVMAPNDLGAHILLFTPDSVVGAPYHRAQQGIRDTLRFFNDPLSVARGVLTERGVTRVVICPQMPEVSGFPDRAPDSFAALYAEGRLPGWLTDITPAGSPLKIYAVSP